MLLGVVYNVPCRYQRPDICHYPMVAACELITRCGMFSCVPFFFVSSDYLSSMRLVAVFEC